MISAIRRKVDNDTGFVVHHIEIDGKMRRVDAETYRDVVQSAKRQFCFQTLVGTRQTAHYSMIER